MAYPPIPATSCPSAPLTMAPAFGVGAQSLLTHGKPHTGVLFQRSSIVGLLFSVVPYARSFLNSLVALAYRMSDLSQVKWSHLLVQVTCKKLPTCVAQAPAKKREACWGN